VSNFAQTAPVRDNVPHPATPDAITAFIDGSVAKIPNPTKRQDVATRMRNGLVPDPAKDYTEAIMKVWSECAAEASTIPQVQFDNELAALLRKLVCGASEGRVAIAESIVKLWISRNKLAFSAQLARGLLGQDGDACAATGDFDELTLRMLRSYADTK
jgi:hypothetical protein